MIEKPLDELYFEWLYSQVANVRLRNPARTFWRVLKQLYTTEFVWFVHNDDNRVAEGIELRYEFLSMYPDAEPDHNWLNEGSSFLEMLIALSRRLSFASEGVSSVDWFWHLMHNVQLDILDSAYVEPITTEMVNEILQRLNTRTYGYDGRGGLFPLKHPTKDQRAVEIWYQMQYYLMERS